MPFPNPQLLRQMLTTAMRDGGRTPDPKVIELRARAAEEQFETAMSMVPEEEHRRLIKMQAADPLGAVHWRQEYEDRAAAAAVSQALEGIAPTEAATTAPRSAD